MGESYLFVVLLALFIATVSAVMVQVIFGLLEIKKRRLQERLGSTPEAAYESAYGPIALEKPNDLTGMLARSQAVQSFNTKLSRAYPGVVLSRFIFMIVTFATLAAAIALVGTRSVTAALFAAPMAGMIPFLIVSSKCARVGSPGTELEFAL